jgi:hypothetical protein
MILSSHLRGNTRKLTLAEPENPGSNSIDFQINNAYTVLIVPIAGRALAKRDDL